MERIAIYNAYLPRLLEAQHYKFEPVDNFLEGNEKWEKENSFTRDSNFLSTYAVEKTPEIENEKSYFYRSQPKIWDYCALLSLFQSRNVFPLKRKEAALFFRQGRSFDWELLTYKEVEKYLEPSIAKLNQFSDRERYVFFQSLVLLFEGEFFTDYSDFKDVWYFQPLELLTRGIYCLDHNISDPSQVKVPGKGRMPFVEYLRYSIDKFGYDQQYGNKNKIEDFLTQLVTVRDWVSHGKVWECDVYKNSSEAFTFYVRVQALLKAFLMSYLGIDDFINRAALIHGQAYGNAVRPIWVRGKARI
ncbi:MAG TPA: hypothetical protein VGP13_02955 [Candidatus Paceibacterota bacterium]|nr:hypothetical protein [Candidatus Paceibacterota bacterium]